LITVLIKFVSRDSEARVLKTKIVGNLVTENGRRRAVIFINDCQPTTVGIVASSSIRVGDPS
jgi:hypothetical protein